MTPNPPSWTESDRLAALARYAILDTPLEPSYDKIVKAIAAALDVPIAVVNFIAEGRQWFKAEVGLGVRETPIDTSFCATAILQTGGMVVPDTTLDPRFDCNPLVTGELGVRFYAGELLQTPEGLPIGTLCVLDTKPRPDGLTQSQRSLLETFAEQVMMQLELRYSVSEREAALARQYRQEVVQRQIQDSAIDHAIISSDMRGMILSWNAGAANVLGWSSDEAIGQPVDIFFTQQDVACGRPEIERRETLETGRSIDERWHRRKDGSRFWASGELAQLKNENGTVIGFVKVMRNQTDRHRMEQALLASEKVAREAAERYALLLTAGAIRGSWMMDLQTGVYTGDDGLAEAFHLDPVALKAGVTVNDVIKDFHPDDVPKLGILKPEVMAVAGPYRAEYRVRGQHGGWCWMETNGRIEHDAAGKPLRAFGVVIGIHSRKITELRHAALITLSDCFRDADSIDMILASAAETVGLLLEADRAGYGAVDLDAGTISVERDWTNGTVSSVVGMHSLATSSSTWGCIAEGNALVVRDCEQMVWPDREAANLRNLEIGSLINVPLLSHGKLVGVAFVNTRTPRDWTDDDVALVREVADRVWTAVSRIKAEQALKQAAKNLEQLVAERTRERNLVWRASQDLFVICGFDGLYRSVNPAWTAALGYPTDELVGTRFDVLVHPNDVHLAYEGVEQLASGKAVKVQDMRMRHKKGDYRWYSWYAVPDGDVFYAAGRDVTDRRHLEEQLRQSQKMEAIGQLTGGIAHDFNNQLHGMLGNLEIAQFRLARDRSADVSRYINAAIDAANRSAALTHRLLAFSRKQTLDPKPTDVNALVTSMNDLINRTTGPAIEVHTVLVIDLWSTLCDPNQLESALLNLIINARDALPDGGHVTIETGNTRLEEGYTREYGDLLPGEFVRISVTDNGAGMTPDIVRRAVDPFFTTKPIGEGTGLGLSMIYGFVKQSQGHLRLYSEPGQGTTVHLYLPRHAGDNHADKAAEVLPLRKAEAAATILLVEDEEVVRTLLTEVIEGLGYTVVAVPNGRQAWGMLQILQPFDLMVTDIGLPGDMNGRQLADAARAAKPDLKVLFITGFAEQAVFGNGMLPLGMEVMTKPFTMTALAEKIADMVDIHRDNSCNAP